jgi:hypothetical protein
VIPSPSPRSRGELTTQLAVACLTAFGITLFSAIAAVAVGQVL